MKLADPHFRMMRPNGWRRSGFTLLEVILAVMILMMMTISIHKFVYSNIRGINESVRDTEEELALERLVALIQEELYNIPPRTQSSLLGEGFKVSDVYYDQMEWRSRGGPGLMTTAASGDYTVRLQLKEVEKGSAQMEIGLTRLPVALDAQGVITAQGNEKEATWVPLLPNVVELKIRYWDARIGSLVDVWRDQGVRPALVILSILRDRDAAPYEAVLTVPAALTQQ